MIISILKGGHGNQMFQYAFGIYLSKLFKTTLFLEIGTYLNGNSNRLYELDIFTLEPDVCVGTVDDMPGIDYSFYEIIREKEFSYDSKLVSRLQKLQKDFCNKDILIIAEGYWQAHKYFESFRETLKRNFSLHILFSGKFLELAALIEATNSVMINVRRGDYLEKLDFHGVISEQYIFEAIAIMNTRISEPRYFVFSDDIPWCRDHLVSNSDLFFVDESYYDHKFRSYFKLMTLCKHFIMSNSTFCWWPAWLSDSSGKTVIAPVKWFATKSLSTKDLIPENWIRI